MKTTILAAELAAALLLVGCMTAGNTPPPATHRQTTCPVMGGRINTNLFVDAEGKRIYVCCPSCLPDLKKDPTKYIQKIEAQGVTLDAASPAAAKK